MDRHRLVNLLAVAALVLAAAIVLTGPASPLAPWLSPLSYENATVAIQDTNGTDLATVDVRVADTERERYIGLSRTDTLPAGEGMLFVHPNSGTYGYVMPDGDGRDMAIPLDIVFIDADGQITTIHHAPIAENTDNPDRTYRGQGRYVLEVPYGWTNATGIDVGDHVSLPESVTA